MCGIAGLFYHADADARVDATVLARMTDTMAHRGPDGRGFWIAPDRRVGLGHRRLAIVDLSPLAAQPMTNEDGTIWITYNGEIYNHQALRAELTEAGHRFRTDHADTEVIVHAYEQWGAKCWERLEGMFAVGLWDHARRRLVLARDRVGVKPLYVSFQPGLVLFASELKAILAHPAVSPALAPAALYHYLTFLATPAPLTMLEGVYTVPAGSSLSIEHDGRQILSRYWDPLPREGRHHRELEGLSAAAREDFCAREIRNLLAAAVEKRLMADVPLGVLLSGGIDSSTNVALMSQLMDRPVDTFTVGFKDLTYLNELDYARQVAGAFGTRHHEVLVGERDAQEYLPDLIHALDEPIADWACLPFHFVSRLAREHGTIVVQVGEGSDEQFCGYEHYLGYLRRHRRYWRPFQRLPRLVQRPAAALARVAWAVTGRGGFYADAVDRAARDREMFWGGAVGLWELEKRRLLRRARFERPVPQVPEGLRACLPESFFRPDSFAVVAHHLAELDRAFPAADVLGRMTYLEFKLRLPELLLMRVDKISMGTSVEARVPFLDHRLVEFTMGIPAAVKVARGVPKALLKRAVTGLLPDAIVHRKKIGFGVPMREWLRGDLGRRVEMTVTRSPLRDEGLFDPAAVAGLFRRHRGGRDLSLPIWTLYTLTAWFDRWVAGRRAA
jgi:asparagine synthase (glutamine-hydrolysing)